jgi:hypothetical protein
MDVGGIIYWTTLFMFYIGAFGSGWFALSMLGCGIRTLVLNVPYTCHAQSNDVFVCGILMLLSVAIEVCSRYPEYKRNKNNHVEERECADNKLREDEAREKRLAEYFHDLYG